MSKRQSDRKEYIQSAGQTDRVTERQNDSMTDSRAAKEPALVFVTFPYYEEPQYIPVYILYGTDVMVPKDLYSYYEGDLT